MKKILSKLSSLPKLIVNELIIFSKGKYARPFLSAIILWLIGWKFAFATWLLLLLIAIFITFTFFCQRAGLYTLIILSVILLITNFFAGRFIVNNYIEPALFDSAEMAGCDIDEDDKEIKCGDDFILSYSSLNLDPLGTTFTISDAEIEVVDRHTQFEIELGSIVLSTSRGQLWSLWDIRNKIGNMANNDILPIKNLGVAYYDMIVKFKERDVEVGFTLGELSYYFDGYIPLSQSMFIWWGQEESYESLQEGLINLLNENQQLSFTLSDLEIGNVEYTLYDWYNDEEKKMTLEDVFIQAGLDTELIDYVNTIENLEISFDYDPSDGAEFNFLFNTPIIGYELSFEINMNLGEIDNIYDLISTPELDSVTGTAEFSIDFPNEYEIHTPAGNVKIPDFESSGNIEVEFGNFNLPSSISSGSITQIEGFELNFSKEALRDINMSSPFNFGLDKITVEDIYLELNQNDNKVSIPDSYIKSNLFDIDINASYELPNISDLFMNNFDEDDLYLNDCTVKIKNINKYVEEAIEFLEQNINQSFPREGDDIILEFYGRFDDIKIRGMNLDNF